MANARRRSRLLALVLVLGGVGVGVSGCGSTRSSATTASRSGPAIFAAACVVCHSLNGHPKPSQQGGDLRGYLLTPAQLESFTREMPAHPPLSAREVTAVSAYLFRVQRHPPGAVH